MTHFSEAEVAWLVREGDVATFHGANNAPCLARLSREESNRIGMCGEWAFARYMGHEHGWRIQRWFRNTNPALAGDGGHDLPGLSVDVKSSRLSPGRDPLDHHLIVRGKDYKPGWVYVLALVAEGYTPVHLMGWATAEALPSEPEAEGPFAGARVLLARHLMPLPPWGWSLRQHPTGKENSG